MLRHLRAISHKVHGVVDNINTRLRANDEAKRQKIFAKSKALKELLDSQGWKYLQEYLRNRREMNVRTILSGSPKNLDELRARANEIDGLFDWIEGGIKEAERLG